LNSHEKAIEGEKERGGSLLNYYDVKRGTASSRMNSVKKRYQRGRGR